MADQQQHGGGRNGSWKRRILDIIHGHYKEALDMLPLEHMPSLSPRLLDAGACFGFADPVTNIITNTVSVVRDEDIELKPSYSKKRKRKRTMKTKASGEARAREEVLSKIAAKNNVLSPSEAQTIAERSLKGLVIFLTSYFRHLPTRDALHYIYLARADLLVAIRLIELDRCLRRKDQFCIRSHATKTALKCAALSARLLMVDSFLSGSFGLVSHLELITQTVATEPRRCLTVQDIYYLSGLVKKPLKLKKSDNPMDLAVVRIPLQDTDASIEKVPGGLTDSLRGVLLDRIHGLYLKAVSRLPMKDFRIRHHRGLLKAGYCYGPFNPVSNIIVNTIWYDTAFPASKEFEVDMICTMRHVESRSLNGLIAFLCASIPDVSEHEAMIYLLKNDLKVGKAIQMVNQEHHTSGSDEIGYKAAADASSHPKPEEFLKFAMQILPTVLPAVTSLMQASHMISSTDITCLSRLLANSSYKLLEPTVELTKDAVDMLSNYKEEFLTEQRIVRRKVEAALQDYEQTKGYCYDLRMICGVNDSVGKIREIRDSKRQFSHVNFWASAKNEETAILFFAEFSNDEDSGNHQSICYPVSGMSVHDARCCYCESEGIRIVHPTDIYWEGASDFEKICCGEHKVTNANIISRGKLIDNSVRGIFREHYIYLDSFWDCKLIPHMNRIAWEATLSWEEQIRVAAGQNRNKLDEDHDRMPFQS